MSPSLLSRRPEQEGTSHSLLSRRWEKWERRLPSSRGAGRSGNVTFPPLRSAGEQGTPSSLQFWLREEEGTSRSHFSRARRSLASPRRVGNATFPVLRWPGEEGRRRSLLSCGRRTFRAAREASPRPEMHVDGVASLTLDQEGSRRQNKLAGRARSSILRKQASRQTA